jgi:hypothetical protein
MNEIQLGGKRFALRVGFLSTMDQMGKIPLLSSADGEFLFSFALFDPWRHSDRRDLK